MIKYCFSSDFFIQIFYDNKLLIQLIYEAIGSLNEQFGLRLIRVFNGFVINHLTVLYSKNMETLGPALKDFIIEHYFQGFLLGGLIRLN